MLTVGDASVLEGNAGTRNAVVTVSLTEPHGNSITVDYRTSNGTAGAGSDYNAVSGRMTFARNEMTKSILIPIIGDRIPEADRYFSVGLSNPKGAKIADGFGLVTVVDDEPRIGINDVSVPEGNSGATPSNFTVWLSAAYDLPVTVNFATADGSASAGTDYRAASGAVTFAPGQTIQTITVPVNGDRVVEPNKTFLVNLSTPNSYAEISRGVAEGTIVDSSPRISIGGAWNYGETTLTFTVSLSAAYDQAVTVNFATVDRTALAGVDYAAASGTLTFAPGQTSQTITVRVLDPTSAPDKYFQVHFSGASPNALLVNEWATGYWYYDYVVYDAGQYSAYPDYACCFYF